MKKHLLLVTLLTLITLEKAFSQKDNQTRFYCAVTKRVKDLDIEHLLTLNNMNINQSAERAINRIMRPLGLPANFVLISCPNIENAVAITTRDGVRYILYDHAFIERIAKQTSSWANIAILAHEIGHHLCGHTLESSKTDDEQKMKELQADEFSGFVLCKLDATLDEALSVLRSTPFSDDNTSTSHPSKANRLNAITHGYQLAKSQGNIFITKDNSPEKFFSDGQTLFYSGEYENAIEKLDIAIKLKRDYHAAYCFKGLAELYLDDTLAATEDINKAIKMNPKNSFGYYFRAFTVPYPACMKDLNTAIEIDPKYADAYYMRAYYNDYHGNYKDAVADYTLAIRYGSKSFYAYLYRGVIESNEFEQYDQALKDFNKAIDIDPSQYMPYYRRGQLYLKKGDTFHACQDFERACELGDGLSCHDLQWNYYHCR